MKKNQLEQRSYNFEIRAETDERDTSYPEWRYE